MKEILIVIVIFTVAWIISTILLLIPATGKQNPLLLVPWLVVALLVLIIGVGGTLCFGVILLKERLMINVIVWLCFIVICKLFTTYIHYLLYADIFWYSLLMSLISVRTNFLNFHSFAAVNLLLDSCLRLFS